MTNFIAAQIHTSRQQPQIMLTAKGVACSWQNHRTWICCSADERVLYAIPNKV